MASRSLSPISSRTPESSIKKNGNFHNPSKHSISSDVHQRSSGSKAGTPSRSLRASLEQKENEKDHHCVKQGKVRSPAMASSKNFMAPTISASSKVVAASPRRRILGEHNEVASVSDSPKSFHGSSETRMMDLEIKNSEVLVVPRFPLSPVPDPLPPYDPVTNYLSPRPRFLHYKPNPQVDRCHLKKDEDFADDIGGHGKWLEDSFSSESFEDSTEEDQSSDLQKSSEDEGKSSELRKESEEEEEEVSVVVVQDETKPQSVHGRTRSTSRSKLAPFLLVLVMACLCVPLSDSPLVSPSSVLKEGSFAKLYIHSQAFSVLEELQIRDYLTEIAASAKLNLEELGDRFSHWSLNTMAYLTTMPWFQKESEFGVFHLANLSTTALDEDTVDSIYSETKPKLEYGNVEPERERSLKENMAEEEEEEEVEEEQEDESFLGPEPESRIEAEASERREQVENESSVLKIVEETNGERGPEEIQMKVFNDVPENNHEALKVENESSVLKIVEETNGEHGPEEIQMKVFNDVPENNHEALKVELPVEEAAKEEDATSTTAALQLETERSPLVHDPVGEPSGNVENLENAAAEVNTHALKLKEIMKYGAGICVAVIAAVGSIAVLYMKQRKTTDCGNHICDEKHSHGIQKFTEEVEMTGYSGSSDGSISLKDKTSVGQHRVKRSKHEESLSHERNLRRDSTASSSISYGSFTTYERLSAKKGARDEGAVTPVRRSSRIRSQVSSP